MPKNMGGLGLRKMFEVNMALVAKLGWRLVESPDSLWVRITKSKYRFQFPGNNSINRGGVSWLWRGISLMLPMLLEGLFLLPRRGEDVRRIGNGCQMCNMFLIW